MKKYNSFFGMTCALMLSVGCGMNPSESPVPRVTYENEGTEYRSDPVDVEVNVELPVSLDAGMSSGNETSPDDPVVDAGEQTSDSQTDAGVTSDITAGDAGAPDEEGHSAECVALDTPSFFAQRVWGEVLSNDCIGCHNSQGLAASSDLVLQSPSQLGFMEANLETATDLALTQYAGTSKLILKPLGELSHGGGALIEEGGNEYMVLTEFVSRIEDGVVICDEDVDVDDIPQESHLVLRPLINNLRTVFLDLIGRLPTRHEYLQVQTRGEAGYRNVLLNAMQEDGFYLRLKEMFNDLLLTDKYARGAEALALLNSNTYPARYWYEGVTNNGQRNRLRDYANLAVAQEPLELIAYVVKNDKPVTEILTADYMMVNGFSANSYGLQESFNYPSGGDEYDPEYHEYRVYRMEGIPHAGILTTRAFLNRFPTTDTNRNRHRARMFFQYFLATDILSLGERPIDPTVTETHNPTLNDPQCTVCHAALDPMAGTFQNWGVSASYDPPELGWFLDMRAPGLSEDTMVPTFEHTASLQWLSQEASVDPRFVWAMVYNTYWMLTGNTPLTPVNNIQDEEGLSAFLAYERQNEYFEQLGNLFVASDYNLKQLFVELTLSEYYRTVNLDTEDAELQHAQAHLGADQLLTPENLARKIVAVTGYPWRSSRGARDYLQNEFEMFYGGIDSDGTTTRIREPNGIMANITRRMAMDMQCISVGRDFVLAPEHRRFFPYVERDIVPQLPNGFVVPQAIEAIKKNIKFLYLQILDESVPLEDIEIEVAYQLWFETWMEGHQKVQDGTLSATLSTNCQGVRDYVSHDQYPAERRFSTDSNYVVRAWGAVITFMLGDYHFFME